MTLLHIRPLDKLADVSTFSCGQLALDQYLALYASQDVRRNVSRIFLASPTDSESTVVGYYSLSAASVQCADLPASLAKKLPKYPVPVALLGRLAVSTDFQKRGIGSVLLIEACKKVVQAESVLAVTGLVVDVKDDAAATFYSHFGFMPLENMQRRFFLGLQTLRQLV